MVSAQRDPDSLLKQGARIRVEFYVSEADLRTLGEPPPGFEGRCEGDALIDTGALIGAIESAVAEGLGLIPVRDISIHTTGGQHDTVTYIVGLRVSGVDLGTYELAGTDGLARNGFIALLGREFLAGRIFVYDGVLGRYTVSGAGGEPQAEARR